MRNAYLQDQKRRGRRVLAVMPIHYPKPLLTAFDVVAAELWGPPGPPRSPAAARVQSYVCSVVRNALAFLSCGGAEVADGALFPHTCDSIQGLATIARDFGGWGKQVFTFLHPKGPDRPSARRYLSAELAAFSRALEHWTGKALDRDRLSWAIDLHESIDAARGELLGRRHQLAMSDRELYALLRRGEFLWPEDHLAELRQARQALRCERVQSGVPLLATGYVPEPGGLLDVLADAGAYLAADDYAAIGRRLPVRKATRYAEPLETLVDAWFALPPCPTRDADQAGRMAHLQQLRASAGAVGVLVHEQKFCEPELFDVPAIRQAMGAHQVPVLFLEGELERELSGQVLTRIEAFCEMLASRRVA
jgi:benzoyl-CoA reductase/2-hydroxyglutaryl-CoA dehydratase subunit BcrC/BadD/HgdB